MLEAQSHNHLKTFLQGVTCPWPHHLTLSRLIARSLRRKDNTLIHLEPWSPNVWWPGLLIPLCLDTSSAVLILSKAQRSRLFQKELPRLKYAGFDLPFWEGSTPPPMGQVWLMDTSELIQAHQQGYLNSKQLIVPEAEVFSRRVRSSMSIEITSSDWEVLRRAHPSLESSLISFYEKLNLQLFSKATSTDGIVKVNCEEIIFLQRLVGALSNSPQPWSGLNLIQPDQWISWAHLDHKLLNWKWKFSPLEPLQLLNTCLRDYSILFISSAGNNRLLRSELESASFIADVEVSLTEPNFFEPIELFAPPKATTP